jgi:hypothetical protein
MRNNYIFKKQKKLVLQGTKESIDLDIEVFMKAIILFDEKIHRLTETAEELFAILGMRNLSAFVGELFVVSLAETSAGLLVKNPHQDGYPDLLMMTEEGKKHYAGLIENMQDKKPFSGFATGGIEVKATCGSVPTPAILSKKGLRRPDMGDQRVNFLTGYDWKAHHRETNDLVAIVWDFFDGVPTIVGLFFSSDLEEVDWGKIVQPKEGGGRTTSVSIMTREGIKKMYDGWVAVLNDQRYIDFFNKFNKSELIDRA